jgi:hypothetical protein
MSLNPQKSREARSQIGQQFERNLAAVSIPSHPQDSLTRGFCDLRGVPTPACGRDALPGQLPSRIDADLIAAGIASALLFCAVVGLLQQSGVIAS